ncbi:hypothetical protein LEP1GSC125_3194 [Leptospira mayottensis 200901122]|uniref:Uncharacterized protein n=1 Tax=Leptospira mayottensis 200901122 TaxID=1193010 RepID=A0AA87MMB7_9LEPT|nr:hypothetical protein LEP1GSC125_3194 [Leptospira mayottensis 200901122]
MLKDDWFSGFPTGADTFSLLTIIFIPIAKLSVRKVVNEHTR